MKYQTISLKSLVGLCLMIAAILLIVAGCEDNPAEPEQKIMQIWTLGSGMGEATLYHNCPENFEGNATNLNGLSPNITPLYLTSGDSYLWSIGTVENHAKKILRIDPQRRIVTERDITSAMLDKEPGGIAWSNGMLWCAYVADNEFVVCTLDPETMTENIQTQFSLYFSPYYWRIRGIDIDEANNLLWIGWAFFYSDITSYYYIYEAFNITKGVAIGYIFPDHFIDLGAGDIKVGESYIWSTNKDEKGDTIILKTYIKSGQTHRMYTTDAGAEGIAF